MSEVMVSVMCTAYNHEPFIAECLESLVHQKTNFKYEILVNDDASPDNTAEIAREYEEKYPDKVRAFCQEENMNSRKISCINYLLDRAQGEYVAICEGDDYWLNESKLQEQLDYMENNPDCAMCITAAQTVGVDSKCIGEIYPFSNTGDYKIPDYLRRKSNIPTASIFTRKEDLIASFQTPYKKISNVGDVPIGLYMFSKSYVHYENRCDVAYRINNPNSWVGQNKGEKYVKHLKNSIEVHKTFDEYTKGKYADSIAEMVRKKEVDICILEKKFMSITREYKDVVKCMPFKKKLYVYIGAYASYLMRLREKIRRK